MFRRMSIRLRMSLWVTLLMLLLLTVVFPMLYLSLQNSLNSDIKSQARESYLQLTASVEMENDEPKLTGAAELTRGTGFVLWDRRGTLVLSKNIPESMIGIPFKKDRLEEVPADGISWMVMDGTLQEEGETDTHVRICVSMESVYGTLRETALAMAVATPLLLLLAFFGGSLIAQRSLSPVRNIVSAAEAISQENLSARVPATTAKDEVAELSQVLNNMLERLESSFRKEQQFSSNASHELRTPVAVITAYTEELLENRELSEEQRKSLQTIYGECKRMNRIIAQMLLMSRGQEGRYSVQTERIDPEDILPSIREQLLEKADEKEIRIVCRVDEGAVLKGDQSLITQLLLNLMENGIKYGKQQGLLEVTARQSNSRVFIAVKDDGQGIPTEALPRIYDRFFRVDAARDRTGAGLGLSIARWIVQVHQGEIDVESTPGQGTTFTVKLPAWEDKKG